MLEENKSQTEELHWSEDPEKEYFREMMAERGVSDADSILGNTTIEGIYSGKNSSTPSADDEEEKSLGSRAFNDEDSLGFSVHQDMVLEEFSRQSQSTASLTRSKPDPLSLGSTPKATTHKKASDEDSFGYEAPSAADDDSYGFQPDPNGRQNHLREYRGHYSAGES